MDVRVLVCGGGTGGHVYPALAVMNELGRLGVPFDQVLWIGTVGQMEEKLVPRAGFKLETIAAGPIAGLPWMEKIKNGMKLIWSIGTASRIIRQFKPTVLFLTGGYVNAPVAVAAKMHRVPSMIYLPDVEPGSAIKALLPLVDLVGCTAQQSEAYLPKEKMVVTGYPVRRDLRDMSEISRSDALARFDLTAGRPTLFVFGGSRGARSINRALMKILPQLLERIQLIHISGELDWEEVAQFSEQLSISERPFYRPYPYLHERMGAAFRSADLVVARAGASMLGEAPAFGVPTILIPYPHVWRYQKVNADYLTEEGAGIRLNDEELDEKLLSTIERIFDEVDGLSKMRDAAKRLDRPDAAIALAEQLISLGRGKR